jgi:heat shock protein HtpX
VSAIAATTAGAIALLSDFILRMTLFGGRDRERSGSNPIVLVAALLAAVLAPIAAAMLKAAISRKREALADASAVEFTRNPTGLRRALETLQRDSTVVHQKSNAVAHMWIESPLDSSMTSKLFATHPPLATRIEILKQMEQSA